MADADDAGKRCDKVIRKILGNLSLSSIYKAIRKGNILVNDKKTSPSTRINAGDLLKVSCVLCKDSKKENSGNGLDKGSRVKNRINKFITSATFPYTIIYQNKDILVLDKEYNMLSYGGPTSFDSAVKGYYKKNFTNNSLSFTPAALHALDKKTSGLLCFCLSLQGAVKFSIYLKEHLIIKTYIGVIEGRLKESVRWESYIYKSNKNATRDGFHTVKVIDKVIESKEGNIKGAKLSITYATPLKYGVYNGQEITLTMFKILTGRTHQIRAQAAFYGHPLLGDTAYGGQAIKEERDFFLHAHKMEFIKGNDLGLPSILTSPIPSCILNLFS